MDNERDDAALVAAALAGDRDAFAAIYDRHAPAVYNVCAHMLGNRDDAADVAGDVFLTAAERLGQLRDPSRLRPWLLAIARRGVFLRTKGRSRLVPVWEVEDVTDDLAIDHGAVERVVEDDDLAAVMRDASAGLDEADRMVLQLHLQGLEGADLADALGVSATNAYQASHRMKERLGRSLGALLVARQGRADCAELDGVLRDWDGHFSVLWRKRVARHVDGCEVCERRRTAVPALLLEGVASATPVLAVPVALRERVLGVASVGTSMARPWRADGFPPPDRARIAPAVLVAAAAVLVALVVGAVLLVARGGGDDAVVAERAGAAATITGSSTAPPATVAAVPPTTAPASTAPASTAVPARVTTTRPPTTAAPSSTTTSTTTSTTSTTLPDRTPPRVVLGGPAAGCGPTTYQAKVVESGRVTGVVLRWTLGGVSGSAAMSGSGGAWTGQVPLAIDSGSVSAVATDGAGNRGTSNALNVQGNCLR